MAAEEKVVLRRNSHGVSHKYGAVAAERGGHAAGDAEVRLDGDEAWGAVETLQFGVLLSVHNSRDRDAEVWS